MDQTWYHSHWAYLGLTQQQRIWYGVLQFIPSSIIIWIGTIVALAVGQYCRQSNSVHFAHLWITIFKFIVTTVSILCCLRFYSRMKTQLLQHRILLKLFTFKSIIGLNVAQTVRQSRLPISSLAVLQWHLEVLARWTNNGCRRC
jgi:uncharacterized membrane protein